jgi:hypothetical protein
VQSEPPPSVERPDSERTPRPEPRPERGERDRRRLERLLPELIKRMLETGFEKLSEAPENARNLVNELKLPKEILSLLLAQVDETKNGLYRVVAKETRDFLEHTNFAEELARVLTTLSFEIKTEIRFIPNSERFVGAEPEVKASVRLKRNDDAKPDVKSETRPDVKSETRPEAKPDDTRSRLRFWQRDREGGEPGGDDEPNR